MLLGIARTADLAGWGTVPPSARTTVNITTATNNSFLVTPRNYIDNPNVYTSTTGAFFNIVPPVATSTMDQTGITTNGQQATWAYTIKFGTDYLTTAPSNGTPYGALFYDKFTAASTSYFCNMGFQITSGVYNINSSQTTGGGGATVPFNNFNSLRNTWLGIVISISDTSTSFANWTGGAGSGYQRTVISDIATGAILQQTDQSIPGTLLDRALTNQYYYDQDYSAAYRYEPFWYYGFAVSDWSQYYMSDFDVASQWINWGSALDPAVYYASLTGSAVNTTVASQRAWLAYNIDNGTNTANGYTFTPPTGSRLSSGSSVASNNGGTGSAAQLVAF